MIQEPLPTGDGFDGDDGGANGGDGAGWQERSAEERASAAAPAPALADSVVLPARLRTFIQGVSVNPAGHQWADDNVVSGAEARRLKDCLSDWCGEAAGAWDGNLRRRRKPALRSP